MIDPARQQEVQALRESAARFEAQGYPVTAILFRQEVGRIENETEERKPTCGS
jgi:hypothetical protein